MRDVLEHHGYRTLEADDRRGRRSRSPASGTRSPVLMDVQLPGMDGVEALGPPAGRSRAPRTSRVVALTAFAMKDDRERFLAAGFDGYLEKPIDVRTLPATRSRAAARDGREPTT